MSLIPRSLAVRRGAAFAGLFGAAAALSVGAVWRTELAREAGRGIGQGVNGLNTVAAMIADRSPGERLDGALATLKPKRAAALHARALPKVRFPQPFATLVGAPPIPTIPPSVLGSVPLYNMVAAAPPVIVPPAVFGGPPVIVPPGAFIPGGPGGGGGVIVPPAVVNAPPQTPVIPTPLTPAVPEPASWAMMLVGFMLLGRSMRRERHRAGPIVTP